MEEDLNLSDEIDVAVHFSEPERTKRLNDLINQCSNEHQRKAIVLIKKRIENANIIIKGYSPDEIRQYQSVYARFGEVLCNENYQDIIQRDLVVLRAICFEIRTDLETKTYENEDARKNDIQILYENKRVIFYIEQVFKREDSLDTTPHLEQLINTADSGNTPTESIENIKVYGVDGELLNHSEIALILHYNKIKIRNNIHAVKVAQPYGEVSHSTLWKRYSYYQNSDNRNGDSRKRSLRYRIRYLENIKPFVNEKGMISYLADLAKSWSYYRSS